MSQSTKRVFLSYGTRDALEVAMWLHGALTSRRYQVFWDKEGLRETTGSAWDRHLEEAIRTHDVVVALMSPHSVRPEGECRNEISFAKDLGKPIVPVMVRQCERPLRVHDLQYVDLEAFPRVGEPERSAWLEEIIRFIENGVPVDPALSELRRRFRPLDYERVLRRNPTDPFTGRKWLFDRIDQWIANPDAPSTLFVVGGPGVGKTSAMAHWCRESLKVGAYHFCDHAQPDTARDVVASLAGQLLSLQALHPSYPEALRVLDTAGRESSDTSSGSRDWTAVEWFRKLVLDPLRHDPPETPWVLVIDALDEALPEVRKMLRECHGELPSMVRLLITSRPDRDLVAWFRGALEIDASSEDNQRDLRQYVGDRLHLLKEAGRIESASDIVDRFAGRLVDASAGTFLYCAEVLDSIAAGHRAVSNDTVLPEGLGGVYAEFLGRNFPDPEGSAYRELRAALEVALGAKQTVDDRFIGAVLDIDEDDVADLRRSLGSLMVSGIEWRFFHKSFADWLGDGEASSYGVRRGRGVRRILKVLDRSVEPLRRYALRWRAAHHIDEGKLEEACALLTDFSVLKARVEAGLVRGVLEDMDTLMRAASGAPWPVPEELRIWQRLFRRRREFWEQFPDEFHQDCLNEAEGLPTTESAKANPIDKPWIRWVNKPEHEVRHQWEWMVRDAFGAAISPDGRTVAVGGVDGSMRLIDVESGQETMGLVRHGEWMLPVAFSPDGVRVLTISHNMTCRIWEQSCGQELLEFTGDAVATGCGRFSPDGSRILVESDDSTARIWDASNGAELFALRGHLAPVRDVNFSRDGLRVLTASDDMTARIWDASSGVEMLVLRGHCGPVRAAQFTPDGARVVTSSDDKTARIWDASSGAELTLLQGHNGQVISVAFNATGTKVLTASSDRTARIWDVSSGAELVVLRGHEGSIHVVAFSPDGSRVLTTSADKTARIWDTLSGTEQSVLRGHVKSVEIGFFSPDGSSVLTASADKTVRMWDIVSNKVEGLRKGHQGKVRTAILSHNATTVLTASEDGTARIWDRETGDELMVIAGHNGAVRSAVFHPLDQLVATASKDHTARVWDLKTGAERMKFEGHDDWVQSVAFSPNGAQLLTASNDRTVRLWNCVTGSELLCLSGHDGWVLTAEFAPDGCRAVTASHDMTSRLWDLSTGECLLVFRGHTDHIWSATFSPDGQRVLTASSDGTARVWDVVTGKELHLLVGHIGGVRSANFSPDGNLVVTASFDYTTRLWRLDSGTEISVLRGHTDYVSSAIFSPDGCQVLTASDDKTVRIWDSTTGLELMAIRTYSVDYKSNRLATLDTIESVHVLRFVPDSHDVVIAAGQKLSVFKLSDSASNRVLAGHSRAVRWLDCSSNGMWLASGPGVVGGSWNLVNIQSGTCIHVPGDKNFFGRFHHTSEWLLTIGLQSATVWRIPMPARTSDGVDVDKYWRQSDNDKSPTVQYCLQTTVPTVFSVVCSVDESRVLTASEDKTARIWDSSTGAELLVLRGHIDYVSSAIFNSEGSRVLTASNDKTARIWDASTGVELMVFRGHTDYIRSAVFNPEGSRVLTASDDKTARIWDVSTGVELIVLRGHTDYVRSAVFNSEGSRVLTSSDDKTARIWDASTGVELMIFRGHTDYIRSAVFNPEGSRVLTASDDKTARIWDTSTGAELMVLRGHTSAVRSAVFNPEGSRVLTASDDKTARVWDASTGVEIDVLRGHRRSLISAVYSFGGSLVFTTSHDRITRMWDASTFKELAFLRGTCGWQWLGNEQTYQQLTEAIASGPSPLVFQNHSEAVTGGTLSKNAKCLLTWSTDWTARVWNLESGEELVALRGHTRSVTYAAFSSDDSKVATVSDDGTSKVWETATGKLLHTIDSLQAKPIEVSFRDGDKTLMVRTETGELLFDIASRALLPDHDSPIRYPERPTLLRGGGHEVGLSVRGLQFGNAVVTHLDSPTTPDAFQIDPLDPLSFAAGCADGSVRFFRLEGVELPVTH